MKVVLNRCFGGFGLSPLAIKKYAEYSGQEVYFYEQSKYRNRDHFDEWRKLTEDDELARASFITCNDCGTSFRRLPTAIRMFNSSDLKRNDEILVRVVEELGTKANGTYASLQVIEIPDETFDDSYIDDYDGVETIHENHKYWP